MYEKCKSEYLLMFTASANEDIDTELFETSRIADMQITTVNYNIVLSMNLASFNSAASRDPPVMNPS